MPLIKSAKKSAFEKNVTTEMKAHPGNRAQDLAIAYSVQRKARKKKASGGTVESGSRDMNYADGGEVDSTDKFMQRQANKPKIKGVHKAVMPSDPGTSIAGAYHGKYGSNQETSKRLHKENLEEARSMPKPKLQGLAEGGKIFPKEGGNPVVGTKSRYGHERGVNPTSSVADSHGNDQGTSIQRFGGKEGARTRLSELKSMPNPKLQGLAEGGEISAKTEKRPMPSSTYNDAKNVSENSGNKILKESGWTDRSDIAQSQRGPKTTRIKHPKMVKSDVLQVRLRDEEDDLQSSAGTNEGPEHQPPQHDNEEDAASSGRSPTKQTAISTGKQVMADGGMAEMTAALKENTKAMQKGRNTSGLKIHPFQRDKMADGGKVEDSDYNHSDPNAATDSFKDDTPSEDEGESMAMAGNEEHQAQTSGDPDMSEPHNQDQSTAYNNESDSEDPNTEDRRSAASFAEGGDVEDGQPEPEQHEEHHDSIAAAIMANRDRMHAEIDSGARDLDEAVRMAEGGEADLEYNAKEQPNEYPPMNGEALDWDKDAEYLDSEQPMDSNETGDTEEDETSDPHDMVNSIRKKMKAKWKLSEV